MSADKSPLKRRLREKRDYLVTTLRVSNYLDALFGAEVISDEDMEKLKNQSDRFKQTRYLLDILSGKSEESIERFLEMVKTKKDMQPHIYWELFPEHVHPEERANGIERDGLKQVTGDEVQDQG